MRAPAILALGTAAAAAAGLAAGGGTDGGHAAAAAGSASARGPAKVAFEVRRQGASRWALRAPARVRAGLVELTLRVPAGRTTHDAQLIRVEDGHTIEDVLEVLATQGAAIPAWARLAGGVGQTDGRAVGRAVQRLQPGRYVVADTDEPEGDDVKSYAESGAIATFTVTGAPTRAKLPRARATITASEYAFSSRRLRAGRVRVALRNAGRQPHHVIAFPYRRGVRLADVKAFFADEGGASGPPPVDFSGAFRTAALEGTQAQLVDLDLRRGRYALVCFLSDRGGGPPHMAKGMISEAVVR